MGQSHNLKIANLTETSFSVSHYHSYQMVTWDSAFNGASIGARSVSSYSVESSSAAFKTTTDDGGDVEFLSADGNLSLKLAVHRTSSMSGSEYDQAKLSFELLNGFKRLNPPYYLYYTQAGNFQLLPTSDTIVYDLTDGDTQNFIIVSIEANIPTQFADENSTLIARKILADIENEDWHGEYYNPFFYQVRAGLNSIGISI